MFWVFPSDENYARESYMFAILKPVIAEIYLLDCRGILLHDVFYMIENNSIGVVPVIILYQVP